MANGPASAGATARPTTLRVAMAVYGDITFDSRVQREATALSRAGHRVTLFCLARSTEAMPLLDPEVRVVAHSPGVTAVLPGSPSPFRGPDMARSSRFRAITARLSWLRDYVRNLRAWGHFVTRSADAFDVWHLHDFPAMAAASRGVPAAIPVIYDVHDLFVETGTARGLPATVRRLIRLYERRVARRAAAVVCVNAGVAATIARRYRLSSTTVVHNCPPRWAAPEPRPDLIRAVADIPHTTPIVLYHGLLGSNRGLERLFDVLLTPEMQDVHLVYLGYGTLREWLRARAADPLYGGRAHVLDAVPPSELLAWVASADVGVMALPRTTLNLFLSTPNKLFECLAAGTPVVASDFPAIRTVVVDDPLGPLGVVCDPADTQAIARAIHAIVFAPQGERSQLRRRCSRAAHSRWSWEVEAERLVEVYGQLVMAPPGGASPA